MSALLNSGIYTVPDASRLTGVSMPRIRRWLRGYKVEKNSAKIARPELWHGQLEPINDRLALGFQDLIEVRFVDAFLKAGVGWKTLREARVKAQKVFQTEHPFCTLRFVTDGCRIFESRGSGRGRRMIDLAEGQRVFPAVIKPFLKELQFAEDAGTLESWWPLGKDRQVVLDPTRSFGQPIIAAGSVPTEVLFNAVKAGQSVYEVAQWYEVPLHSVRDAARFERSLQAA